MKRVVRVSALFLLVLFLPFAAFADLQVHFLDVGQGDCTVVLCDGEAMVIDGGPRDANQYVYSYIRNTLGLYHLDYVIATHPDADHVSGLAAVLNAVMAEVVVTPVTEWHTATFEKMVRAANSQGAPLAVPQEGEAFPLGGATVTVLHCMPEIIEYDGEKDRYLYVNDSSIVLRIDYGKTSFLVAADAEAYSEYMMIDSGMNLKADVLRVAHHGSSDATTMQFLQAVRPEYAVISVGKNTYGHPHGKTLDRLARIGARVLRTDELGTIAMVSDGESIRVE